LEQDFNSLDAQREACEAYIASQKHEGWELLPTHYDDGGISGGHLERPALQRLMQDIDDKQVDQIIVYKIDRLTRSLADFAKLVDRLDAAEASFVSVTQSFNTSTSMGRLTLNVLLSFAQFEREVTAERIRDKISASKKKGLWMGGNVPLGYNPDGRTLTINEAEAETVRKLYDLYLQHGVLRDVKGKADALNLRTKQRERPDGRITGGGLFERGHIYHILANPIYASHSQKNGKRLRYYISRRLVTERSKAHPDAWRLSAEQLEGLLIEIIKQHLGQSDAAASMTTGVTAVEITSIGLGLSRINKPQQIFELIGRVDLKPGSLRLQLNVEKLTGLLALPETQIRLDALDIEAPFQMLRRGVELKLHLGDAPKEIDITLIQNITKAKTWLGMVIEGQTFTEIAEAEGVSKRRIQAVIELALLSPRTLDAIVAGGQSIAMTSDYLIKTGFSANWSKQHNQFAQL
jgi:site-specific DNA recombinase